MGLRPEEMMNPRAVAYKIPARYKVSAETFLDAAAESLSIEINPINGPPIDEPFLSAVRHPGTEFDRIELVYHETIDAFKVSTTPIIMFSEYQFHTSGDAGDNLCVWVKNLLEIEKPMGKVISIQIPMRSSFQVPNHQVFVYVKGKTTPKAAGLGRQHFLPLHQRNPVKVHWTAHGDPKFCNYCKSEGHVLGKCVLRLSKICTKCKAAGHLQPQCDRFSERDLKTAKGNESERNPPIPPPCDSPPSPSTSAGAASSTPAPSPPHATAALLPLSLQKPQLQSPLPPHMWLLPQPQLPLLLS
ncbi:hypothetical protein BKA57DRAFT_439742 [Linnemannia elongata]|nr:hypothetical protein BKA57DRAFT_439742 [Linnemannia elongata]